MKFNIRGSKVEITEPIKAYIEEKIGKLSKYFDDSEELTANVVVRIRGYEQIIEVTIPAKGIILRGESGHKDLYAAIDLVSEKLERQILKNKTRLKKRVDKGEVVSFNLTYEETPEEYSESVIVRRKEISPKPMSEEEAILQMELLDHSFFVFVDSEDGTVNVLYKRKDNNYGIIKAN